VLINGGQTVKSLSVVFLADLERHWRVHGRKALDVVAEKYPQAYFSGMVALSKELPPGGDDDPMQIEPVAIAAMGSKLGHGPGRDAG
jgi:hypothetical protein